METQTMKAGRDLDALVDLKVMGFVWDEARCRICGWPLYERIDQGCMKESCSMRPRPAKCADEPPPYSTDIAVAWRIVEAINARGWTWTMGACTPGDRTEEDIDHGHSHGFRAGIMPDHYGQVPFYWNHADTMPIAICRAALRAVNA